MQKSFESSEYYFNEWKRVNNLHLNNLFIMFNKHLKRYSIKLYFDTFCRFIFNHSDKDILKMEELEI